MFLVYFLKGLCNLRNLFYCLYVSILITKNKTIMTDIENIKRIINTFGSFSVADLEGEVSPCISSLGNNIVQLAERFDANGVDAVTYDDEGWKNEDYFEYEELEDDVIADINELAEMWEADQLKLFKRISN